MDNADLEKLKISPGKLVPKFKASVTEYSVVLGSDVKEVKISPLTSDGGASYTVKGADSSKTVQLTAGKTIEAEVIVTAEDGRTTKTYCLSIRCLSADDASLAQLDISAGSLRPAFTPLNTSYECYLPCSVESISLRVKTEDPAMKVSMQDGSPVGTVQLNPGHTQISICVTSVSGTSTTNYKIATIKCRLPPTLQLKNKNAAFECAVCCGIAHRPHRIKDGPYLYCYTCLEELTRTSKQDPFTGRKLEEGSWMVADYSCDSELAKLAAVCSTSFGAVEATVQQMGAKLLAERLKSSQSEEELLSLLQPTQACPDCSKKVPSEDMPLHKDLLCSAHHNTPLPKHEMKPKPWEQRLVDESCDNELQSLHKKAKEWEAKYLTALPRPGESPHYPEGHSPMDHLQRAAQCYATALRGRPRERQAHLGLALVMEEFFYAGDLFGLHREAQEEEAEGEAERSSKDEEFLAICGLHGVGSSAPLALQLKAVEAEYHSLKEAGQTHKAEHVQQLYAWKSKKALQASQGSYSVDTESPLYRAKLKFQDAASMSPSDPTAVYHAGRVCLLLGEREAARQYLTAALALRPTLSPARLCLGLEMGPEHSKHAMKLLLHGLSQWLLRVQEGRETQAEPLREAAKELHGSDFYCTSNTLVMDAFLRLSELGGCGFLLKDSALLCVTPSVSVARLHHRAETYKKLLWSSLKARFLLLRLRHKQKDPSVHQLCHQLSALIANSGLPSSPELREMQMEVFQLGVALVPGSSEALVHLGVGQLGEFEATGEEHWLKEAERSFRASIGMEGKPASPTTVPEQLKEQEWWKKRQAAAAGGEAKKQPAAGQTTAATAAKKPIGKQQQPAAKPAGRQPAKPGAQATRSQPAARQTPAKTTTTQPAAKRGPAAKQPPRQPTGPTRPGQVTGGAKTGTGSKGVATLGELKSGVSRAKMPQASTSPAKPQESKPSETATSREEATTPAPTAAKAETNKKTYHPRIGLARALANMTDPAKLKESQSLYREVIRMAPEVHDAYIELGEMLAKTEPVAAVEVYARFPFSDPPSFDDAFLHGEIVRLLMASESYDNPQLCSSMVAMGKALGIGVLEKQVAVLEGKFKSGLLKKVYAGVHGKPVDDPDLQAFFKFKCWL